MSVTTRNGGESNEATGLQPRATRNAPLAWFGDVFLAHRLSPAYGELTDRQWAALFGWAEETCRRYCRADQSPTFDRLLEAVRTGDVPLPLQLALLQLLSDGSFEVVPLPDSEFAPRDQAASLRQLTHALDRAGCDKQEAIDDALADGRVDERERSSIETHVARQQGLLRRMLALLGVAGRRGA